jgi:2',3'-cyclic-nucleotide 2'-phosphodiesterase (5'-nucleotidase family)
VTLTANDPADPALAKLIREMRIQHLTAAESEVVGRLAQALDREAAGQFAARAVRIAAGVDAVLIGNTTFGDGLPAEEVTREAFDACVRFDGTIWVAEVTGERLRAWLVRANQNSDGSIRSDR